VLAGDERLALFLYLHSVPFDLILRALEEANPFRRLLCIFSLVDDHCAILSLDNFGLFHLPLECVGGKKPSIFEPIAQLVYVRTRAVGHATSWVKDNVSVLPVYDAVPLGGH